MKFFYVCCCLIWGVVISSNVLAARAAADLEQIFQASVVVDSQTAQERTQALKTAFEKVLLRLTGDEQLLKTAKIKVLLADVLRYIKQYKYYPAIRQTQFVLTVTFNKTLVKDALQKAQVSIWDEHRKPLMLWLTFDDTLIHAQHVKADKIQKMAVKEGLQIVFPTREIVLIADKQPIDHQGLDIAQAMHAQGVITASVFLKDDTWQSTWRILQRGMQDTLSLNPIRANSPNEALMVGLQQAGYRLARYNKRYEAPTAQRALRITFHDVQAGDHYLAIKTFLNQQGFFENVWVSAVASDGLTFTTVVNKSVRSVHRALLNTQKVSTVSKSNDHIHYRWLERGENSL